MKWWKQLKAKIAWNNGGRIDSVMKTRLENKQLESAL